MTWYRFLLAIRAPEASGWRGWFQRRAEANSAFARHWFGADDELFTSEGHSAGRYRFVETSEVAAAFAQADWFDLAPPCAHIGDVRGFLNWEWWEEHIGLEDRGYYARVLLGSANGYLARTDDGRCFDFVVQRAFPLVEASQKHGFEDGDFFLDVDDAGYHAGIRRRLEDALSALDLRAEFIRHGTSHNPHRFDRLEPRGGESHDAAWARFLANGHRPVRLCGADLQGLRSPAFLSLLTDGRVAERTGP